MKTDYTGWNQYIDGMWECLFPWDYLTEVRWDTMEKGETVSKIYGDINLTDRCNRGKEKKQTLSVTLLGGLSKKLPVNWYFATHKYTNLRVQDVGRVSLQLCKLLKECAAEGSRRNKGRIDRKEEYKRGWLHLRWSQSIHLPDWALCLITTVYLLIKSFHYYVTVLSHSVTHVHEIYRH